MSIQEDIATAIHDNIAGEITPEVLRNILLEMVGSLGQGSAGPQGAQGLAGADGADITSLLNSDGKFPAQYLPPSLAAPHHIFATQADMLVGGAAISAGEMVLVHGDPQADNNGEYVALQDHPTLITHYDHLGEHVAAHRHDGADVDVTIAGHTDTLTTGLTAMSTHLATALQQDGSVDAMGVPFVSLNSTQIAALKANSIYEDDRQKLMFKDNADISHEIISPKHYSGTTDPADTLGADGDLHFKYTA